MTIGIIIGMALGNVAVVVALEIIGIRKRRIKARKKSKDVDAWNRRIAGWKKDETTCQKKTLTR